MPDIYLLIDGQQQGPYTEEQVLQSLAEGHIPPELLAWHEGIADWLPISNVLEKSPTYTKIDEEKPKQIEGCALPAEPPPHCYKADNATAKPLEHGISSVGHPSIDLWNNH